MGILGGDYTHASWGRDILSLPANDSGWAMTNLVNNCVGIDSTFWYIEDIGRSVQFYNREEMADSLVDRHETFGDEYRSLQKRMRAYMQAAEQLCTPATPSP
jgi:hypothetical protein